jgi:MFS family permease
MYSSLLGDLTLKDYRGKVIGCSQFFMYLTQAIAQLLAGALYTYLSPQTPFISLAVGAIPLSMIVLFKVTEPSSKEV